MIFFLFHAFAYAAVFAAAYGLAGAVPEAIRTGAWSPAPPTSWRRPFELPRHAIAGCLALGLIAALWIHGGP